VLKDVSTTLYAVRIEGFQSVAEFDSNPGRDAPSGRAINNDSEFRRQSSVAVIRKTTACSRHQVVRNSALRPCRVDFRFRNFEQHKLDFITATAALHCCRLYSARSMMTRRFEGSTEIMREQQTARVNRNMPCLKETSRTFSIQKWTKIIRFSLVLVRIFLTQLVIKWPFSFHFANVSAFALLKERKTNEICVKINKKREKTSQRYW